MLVALNESGVRCVGRHAEKGYDYTCPGCNETVTVKKGEKVVHHFAHRPGASCDYATGETVRHMEMKSIIASGLSSQRSEIEMPVLGRRRRADVVVDVDGKTIVIECQHSPMSVAEFEQRDFDYNQIGPLIWMLDSSLFFKTYRPRAGFDKPSGRTGELVKALADREYLHFLYNNDLYRVDIDDYIDERDDEWGHRFVTRYVAESVWLVPHPWIVQCNEGSWEIATKPPTPEPQTISLFPATSVASEWL